MCFIRFHFWFTSTSAAMPGPVVVRRQKAKKNKKNEKKKLYGRTIQKSLRAKSSKRGPQLRKVPFSPNADLHPNLLLVFFS